MLEKAHRSLEKNLYHIAYFSAHNPWETIGLMLGFTAIMVGGFFSKNFYVESNMENLYVPSDSLAFLNLKYIKKYFGDEYQELILFEAENFGDNILTKKVFDSLWEIHETIYNVELNGKTYEDYCVQAGDACFNISPVNFWENYADYNDTVKTDEDVQEYCSAPTYGNTF
jgi:hypothetical protein